MMLNFLSSDSCQEKWFMEILQYIVYRYLKLIVLLWIYLLGKTFKQKKKRSIRSIVLKISKLFRFKRHYFQSYFQFYHLLREPKRKHSLRETLLFFFFLTFPRNSESLILNVILNQSLNRLAYIF